MNEHERLDRFRHLIIDMDGVLWRGQRPVAGLPELFDWLRGRDVRFVLATNNSSQTVSHYVAQLERFGVTVAPEEIITSAQATADYLSERARADASVYMIGGEGLQEALGDAGFRLLEGDGTSDYVVVGWDRRLTFEKLAQATLQIRAGAEFVGTNPDRTWPSERGLVPGAGAILAALEAASDVQPTIIGKPYPTMFEIAMKRMGATAASTAMLGDRLDTDIQGGHNAGIATILVLTGVTTPEDLRTGGVQPDLVFDDIAALTRVWQTSLPQTSRSQN
jgi:4-nitrophenyl phosphatase